MGYAYVLDHRLAQGSAPPEGSRLKPAFDTLVLCAEEYQPSASHFDVQVMHVPLDDAKPSTDEIKRAIIAAREVTKRIRSGQRVLSTCAQGLNRSALITSLSMSDLGFSSDEIIRRVKAARGPRAMSNPHFVQVLRSYEARRRLDQPVIRSQI